MAIGSSQAHPARAVADAARDAMLDTMGRKKILPKIVTERIKSSLDVSPPQTTGNTETILDSGSAETKESVHPKISEDIETASTSEESDNIETTSPADYASILNHLKHTKNIFEYTKKHLPDSHIKKFMKENSEIVSHISASIRGIDSCLESDNLPTAMVDSGSKMVTELATRKMKYSALFSGKEIIHPKEMVSAIMRTMPELTSLITVSVMAGMIGHMALKLTQNDEKSEGAKKKKNYKKMYKKLIDTTGNLTSQGTIGSVTSIIEAGRNAGNMTDLAHAGISQALSTAAEYSVIRSMGSLFSHCGNYNFSFNPLEGENDECSVDRIAQDFDTGTEMKKAALMVSMVAAVMCSAYLYKKMTAPRKEA